MSSNIAKVSVMQLITGLGVGGAERAVVDLTVNLADFGLDVQLVSLNNNVEILKQYSQINLPVTSLGMAVDRPKTFVHGISLLVNIVDSKKISIIHAHMFHALVVALLCKFCRRHVRIVFTSHNFSGFNWFRRAVIKNTAKFRVCDVVFSRVQHVELNAKNAALINNGVRVSVEGDRCAEVAEDFVFIFVGRLEAQKDPLFLLHCLNGMKNENSKLLVVGDGYLRAEMEHKANKMGLSARVSFLGRRHDIYSLYSKANCFLMVSDWEGLPVAMLEAGATGLPVISTPVGAIPELLGDNCGYLGSKEEISKLMDLVVDDYPQALNRGKMLKRKIYEQYSLISNAEKHKEIYNFVNAGGVGH